MKISELINSLQKSLDTYGDIEVSLEVDAGFSNYDIENVYYDKVFDNIVISNSYDK